MKLKAFPADDGYYMPAEYDKHQGTILIWPVRPGSWPYGGFEAQETFSRIARELSIYERVYILADDEHYEKVKLIFSDDENIKIMNIKTDDAWARDVGPTFVIDNKRNVRGIDWKFNAWGGEFDGLYAHWDDDNRAAGCICDVLGYDYYDQQDFVLEGGSIHSDGEGTVIVTESCLLSKGRNPELTKDEITERLKKTLGAKKVIWLPRGIYNDETNEHVDNVCAFTGPAEVVLAWTDDINDPQYALSKECLDVLEAETDCCGRKFKVHKLYIPKNPVCVKQEELLGYTFEEGEDIREAGERLAASYVNFYIANGIVLVPAFGDENDKKAIELLASLFKNRKVVGIPARSIILGGGNIHCITQQIPAGGKD